METPEQILARIDELETLLAESEEAQIEFSPDQMVNYQSEDGEGVAMVESVNGDQITVRVMAVAGDTFEPTDDVLTLDASQLSLMDADESAEYEEEEEETDEDEEVEVEEEDLAKGVFATWKSVYGDIAGRIIEIAKGEPVVIPETGDEYKSDSAIALIEVYQKNDGKFEDTGVHVAIEVKNLSVIDALEVKQRRLMVKAKNFELKTDDDNKFGFLSGIGSAYGKVDLGGDTVSKGAYTQTISHNNGKVQLMFNHGFEVADVAGIAELEDSEEGLVVNGKMPLHIPSIKDGYEIAKFMLEEGKPLGFSIGYQVIKSEPLANGVRELQEIALEEMTITPWPMDTHARIRDAKHRKITYNAKRRGWQTLKKRSTPALDAPTGNQVEEGDYKSLTQELKQLKQIIED